MVENTIVITTNKRKNKILLETNKLHSFKFMTKEQFFKRYLFDYTKETIYYIMKNYHVNYDICKIYLKNLYYAQNITIPKIKFLNELKQNLISKKLLQFDPLFRLSINKIIIYDVQLSKFEKQIIDHLNIEFYSKNEEYNHEQLNEFSTVDEEIQFVATSIIQLLEKGININQIKLFHVTKEYEIPLKRIFKYYNIPIYMESNYSLYGNKTVVNFLNKLKETKQIDESLKCIKDPEIKKEIIQILEEYITVELDDTMIECLKNELQNKMIKQTKKKNEIEILKDEIIDDSEYAFYLGFNDTVPSIYRDEDYLTDSEKQQLNIDTSLDKNKQEKEKLINWIKKTKNLTISYSIKFNNENHSASILKEELNLQIVKLVVNKFNYSDSYNKILLAVSLDKLNKYNIVTDDLKQLWYHYQNIPYQQYDNQYTKIEKEKLYSYLDNKLTLSYSSIENYNECGFKFYLSNILKLNQSEQTIFTEIGNIFHEILSKCFNDSFDFEDEYQKMINSKDYTKKEKVFFNKLKGDLIFIIDTIKKQNKYSKLKNELYEKKIYINQDKNIKITFMGIIDKLKYEEKDGKTVVAIIDYKTGFPETDLTKTIHGIKMQLPIYMFLAQSSNLFDTVEIVGCYLQKIINTDILYDPKKDIQEEKEKQLKLEGYSIDDPDLLEELDITYQDSKMIKSMKTTKNGFSTYSKILTKEQIDKLNKLTKQQIEKARDHIIEADYFINPKRIGKMDSCEYCKYRYICYKKEENYITLQDYKDLSFLN